MSSHMISRATALVCLALVVSACAGGATPASPTSSQLDHSTTTVATTAGSDGTSQQAEPTEPPSADSTVTSDAPAVERPAPDPGRPIAPDFSLELADGSTFLLSQETRPVFMVFWAEW